jgi:hypothetical protein
VSVEPGYDIVPVSLTYGRGAVWALCRCGRSFFARGSAGICAYMTAQIAKHKCTASEHEGAD